MLFASTMPTHAEKNRERRVLFPLKRANIAAFGLYDRAAGRESLAAGCCWVLPDQLISCCCCWLLADWQCCWGCWVVVVAGEWLVAGGGGGVVAVVAGCSLVAGDCDW
jgi:hypothetical protein